MNTCPEFPVLEGRPWSSEVNKHVANCGSCRLVMELIDERSQAAASRERRTECVRFEALIAVRVAGELRGPASVLLDEHIHDCADCRAIADTLAPSDDVAADHSTLTSIDPSAYALGAEVARGGMGRIVAARDLRIGRPVAVKELLSKTSTQAARFEREARVTARLQHPGIVPIYEIGKWESGTPFYAMRMVAGRTLRSALAARATLEARLALLPSVIAAAEAVAFAHAHQVIHRDLTPANIMVGDYGETVVIDWGLAKDLAHDGDDEADAGPYRRDPDASADLTAEGAIIGTAAYMPPEQARGERVDTRADVYALGAILYHLLAGQAPFRGGSSDEVLRRVQTDPPAPVRSTVPGAPRDLVSIAEKAMSREAASRYTTAGELADELRRFQTGRVVEAHHYSPRERARRWLRAHRAGVLAGVASAVMLAIVGTIGLAGVLRERDAAEAGERSAQRASTALLGELGRAELLAGNPDRAAALLAEAYENGDSSASLRFLLGSAMRTIESVKQTLSGNSSPIGLGQLAISADGTRVIAVHRTIAEQWTADGKRLPSLSDRDAPLGSVAYSADGNWVVTYQGDDFVRVWNAKTGMLVRKVEVKRVRIAMLAADGRQFLTLDDEGIAKRWDTASGVASEEMRVGVVGRAWDSDTDSGHLVAVKHDGALALWDWERDHHPIDVVDGWRPASRREVSRDGTRYVGCADLTTTVWDRAGLVVRTFHQSRPSVACSIDDDGKRVITVDLVDKSTIWDLATGDVVAEISGSHGQSSATFVGNWLVTAGLGKLVELRDPATGTLLASYSKSGGRPAVSRGEHPRLALPHDDGSIEIVDLDGGRLGGRFVRRDHPGEGIASAAGDLLLTKKDQTATLWDLRTSRAIVTTEWPAALNWTNTHLVAARDGKVVVLDARTGKQLAVIAAGGSLISVDLDRDGKRLVACPRAQPCGVWDVQTAARIATTRVISEDSWASLTPDGSRVIEIQAWVPIKIHALDGSPPQELGDKVFYAALSDDGSRVAWVDAKTNPSMSIGWVLIVAEVATGKILLEVQNGAMTAAFDRSGDLLASFGESGIQLWNVSTGSLLRTIEAGAPAAGLGVALSPDGSLIQTGTGVWSAADGRQLATFVAPGDRPIRALGGDGRMGEFNAPGRVFMSSDGQLSAAFSNTTDVTLWNLGLEARSPTDVKRIIEERVRWRVVEGKLVSR